jgi:hypothetical protein
MKKNSTPWGRKLEATPARLLSLKKSYQWGHRNSRAATRVNPQLAAVETQDPPSTAVEAVEQPEAEGPKRRTREGGGIEWEPIKILLEGDRGCDKNTTSNTRLRLNYPSWPRPRSHWRTTGPRNQHTAYRTKTHEHT